MPLFRLGTEVAFPPVALAEPSGLLAVGGDLSAERLIEAYACGIFPWYEEGLPILWHAPDPRMVLRPDDLEIPRSLAKALRRSPYEVRLDTAFPAVIDECARAERPGQRGTWITRGMRDAYVRLHELGYAHSAEAWSADELVGGLYGVSLGAAFFGESMFYRAPDASKIAFVTLVAQLLRWRFQLVDCQVHTVHLDRFGAELWPRPRYMQALERALTEETRVGAWRLDAA